MDNLFAFLFRNTVGALSDEHIASTWFSSMTLRSSSNLIKGEIKTFLHIIVYTL